MPLTKCMQFHNVKLAGDKMQQKNRFKLVCLSLALSSVFASASSLAQDLKIALIAGKTGALEAYAKETETGFMMGLEYLTGGKM